MSALLLVGSLIPLSGCVTAAVGAAGAVGVAAIQDKSFGESLDDAAASNELKARLMTASPSAFNEVDVEVAGRMALLSGRVPTMADRHEAERIAWGVGLLQDVKNEIQVREKGGVVQNLNDEWITGRVRSRLFGDSEVKSVNVNIETYDGTVYLMGLARSQRELQKIAEHASKVRGVKEVVTYIQLPESRTRARQTAASQPPYQPQPQQQAPQTGGGYNPYAPPTNE
tara:strand:+ start:75386 stop:76066 length:681 start_codon:yes stop_codon:yes gene_type:complete